jgi:hypothetical protein
MRGRSNGLARLCRGAGALGLAASTLVFGYGGTPAQAASTLPATGASWYWSAQIQPIGAICPPPPLPQDPTQCQTPPGQVTALPAPDVPAGDIAVSAKNDGADKVAAIHIDLSSVPDGATITGASLRLVEDSAGGNLDQTTAKVVATPTDYFADDGAGQPINQAPKMDGQPQVTGTRSADPTGATWTFDVSGQLNDCLKNFSFSCGIGLRPPSTAGGTFEVVWFGPKTQAATATQASKPSVTATIVTGTSDTTTTTFASVTTPTTFPSSSSTPSGTLPSSVTPSFVNVGQPLPSVTPPSTTATTVAKSTTPKLNIRRAAKVNHTPPLAFFLAALGLAALVGSSMVALGDAGDPVPARRGSVVRTLERRMGALPSKE